jgi:hypothetical protein
MTSPALAAVCVVFLGLTFVAWRRYLWVAGRSHSEATLVAAMCSNTPRP